MSECTQLTSDGFAEQFTECSRTLWCIAAAVLGDRTHAEDALQEAAVIALGKLDEFDPATSFAAWMGQIVRYVALNSARRRVRQRTVQVDAAAGATSRQVPAAAKVTSWGQLGTHDESFDDRVLEALRGLDETARSCLLMRVVLDLSYREIAQALDIPEGTAMSHVHRARQTLAQRLEDRRPAATRAEQHDG